jgi:hemolysin III
MQQIPVLTDSWRHPAAGGVATLTAVDAEARVAGWVSPRTGGGFHQNVFSYAFLVSLGAGALLVLLAGTTGAAVTVAVYAASVSALVGVSALAHRRAWTGPAWRRTRRLDHAMLSLLVAGTYTPVGLLVGKGMLVAAALAVVWGAAVAGAVGTLAWAQAPRWFGGIVGLGLGWVAVVVAPQLVASHGVAGGVLIVVTGLVYLAGAATYAVRCPDRGPAGFGAHEAFHLMVIAGVATHFLAVSLYPILSG